MDKPLETYTREDRSRIAKTASRNLSSEFTAIAGVGGAVTTLLVMLLGMPIVVRVSYSIGISPTALWLLVSFGFALCVAFAFRAHSKPKIEEALALDAGFKFEQQLKRREEVAAKLNDMNEKEENQQ